MTEIERVALREKIVRDGQRFLDGMAPLYLGKGCPLLKSECQGPSCSWFLLQTGASGKVEGGACSIPLLASQVGPIADGMFQVLAQGMANGPKIIAPPAGLIKG